MATGAVAELREESKRDPERLEEEMVLAVARYASALLSSSDPADGGTHPALLDDRLRRRVASAARRGLQAALESGALDCGARNAPACGSCGGRLRHVCRVRSPVETALGRIRGADGALRLPRLREDRAPAGEGAGHVRRRRSTDKEQRESSAGVVREDETGCESDDRNISTAIPLSADRATSADST